MTHTKAFATASFQRFAATTRTNIRYPRNTTPGTTKLSKTSSNFDFTARLAAPRHEDVDSNSMPSSHKRTFRRQRAKPPHRANGTPERPSFGQVR
jgi:hypothetical protein